MAAFDFDHERFDPTEYVNSLFEKLDGEELGAKMGRLQSQRALAAEDLRDNVLSNYTQFILASTEVNKLEVDMSDLRGLLGDYERNLKALSAMEPVSTARAEAYRTSAANGVRPAQDLSTMATAAALTSTVRKVLALPARLDALLSQRKFGEALAIIVEAENGVSNGVSKDPNGRSSSSSLLGTTMSGVGTAHLAYAAIQRQVRDRGAAMERLLLRELGRADELSTEDTREVIGYLVALGVSEKAEAVFLAVRSASLRQQVRELKFEGDVVSYVTELSRVVFTAISSTCDDFRLCFEDSNTLSNFLAWVVSELRTFCRIFQQQVFASTEEAVSASARLSQRGGKTEAAIARAASDGRVASPPPRLQQLRNSDLNSSSAALASALVSASTSSGAAADYYSLIAHCLEIAHSFCRALEAQGLSVNFVLSYMFLPHEKSAIHVSVESILARLDADMEIETWRCSEVVVTSSRRRRTRRRRRRRPASSVGDGASGSGDASDSDALSDEEGEAEGRPKTSVMRLTRAAKTFYKMTARFVAEVCSILRIELYSDIVYAVARLCEHYLARHAEMLVAMGKGEVDGVSVEKASLAVLANVYYVKAKLLPKMVHRLRDKFNRPIQELDSLRRRMDSGFATHLCLPFATMRADYIVFQKIRWVSKVAPALSVMTISQTDAAPTPAIGHALVYLMQLRAALRTELGSESQADVVVSAVVHRIPVSMDSDLFWNSGESDTTDDGASAGVTVKFGFGGLQQFVLDVKFFLACCGRYMTPELEDSVESLIDGAVDAYCSDTGHDPSGVLKSDGWFRKRLRSAVDDISSALRGFMP